MKLRLLLIKSKYYASPGKWYVKKCFKPLTLETKP